MSFFGGSLRLALKQSLAETRHVASKEKDATSRKKEDTSKKRKGRRTLTKEEKLELRKKKLHAVAAASRKAQQQHLGIQSPTSEKHSLSRIAPSKGKSSRSSNRSMSSSSSLSSSSSSSTSSGSESDSSTNSSSSGTSSTSSEQRNMFDTSSSEEMEMDDKLTDTDDDVDSELVKRELEERMRKDPPSACPKHLLITPHLGEKKRKREIANDQYSLSSSSRNEKRIKNDDSGFLKKSPRSTVGSASDRSMTSKASSSRRVKSRTVTPPTADVIDWIESLSIGKLRKNICSGQRVKVRFVTGSSKKDKKKYDSTTRRIKWYGGCVSEVYAEGKRVRIHYDDGTSEVSDFPDDDIVVDDTENGFHKVSAKAFIPSLKNIHRPKSIKSTVVTTSPDQSTDEKRVMPNLQTFQPERETGLKNESLDIGKRSTNLSDEIITKERRKKEKKNKYVIGEHTGIDEPRHSPPSTKASTVTESSFSLSSNNNSANEYSESSCSIASHDQISTSSHKKIEMSNYPLHNRADPIGDAKFREQPSPLSIDASTPFVPKIKISGSFNKLEKKPSPDLNERHSPAIHTEVESSQQRIKNPTKSSRLSPTLTIKLGGTKTKRDCLEDMSSGQSGAQEKRVVNGDTSVTTKNGNKSKQGPTDSMKSSDQASLQSAGSGSSMKVKKKDHYKTMTQSSIDISKSKKCTESQNMTVSLPFRKDTNEKLKTSKNTPSVSPTHSLETTDLSGSCRVPTNRQEIGDITAIRSSDENDEMSLKDKKKEMGRTDVESNDCELKYVKSIKDETKYPSSSFKNLPNDEFTISSSLKSSTRALSPTLSSNILSKSKPTVVNEHDVNNRLNVLTSVLDTESEHKEPYLLMESKDNAEVDGTCENDRLPRDSSLDDMSLEKSAPIPTSRSGRLAAQKANQRIVSKQDVLDDEFVVPKKKKEKLEMKKKLSSNQSMTSSYDDDNDLENSNDEEEQEQEEPEPWVQCDRCQKWRLLPRSVQMDDLPDHWYCELNKYDPKRNRCDAPEQTAKEIALQKRNGKSGESNYIPRKRGRKKYAADSESRKKRPVSPGPGRSPRRNSSSGELQNVNISRKSNPESGRTEESYEPNQSSKSSISSQYTASDETGGRKRNHTEMKGVVENTSSNSLNEKNKDVTLPGTSVKTKGVSRGRGRGKDSEKGTKGGRGSRQNKEKAENQEWVQCEKCEKWRKLPPRITAQDLPDKWYCDMNTWDPSSASCDVAEDKPDPKVRVYTSGTSAGKLSSGSKLSYRNLIFGTGKRNLRPTSERARAAESLFAFATQGQNASGESIGNPYPTLAYAKSSAYLPKQGGTGYQNNPRSSGCISFLHIMNRSRLWDELYGTNNEASLPIPYNGIHQTMEGLSSSTHSKSVPSDCQSYDIQSMKDLLYHILDKNTLSANEICLEAQCREIRLDGGNQWDEVRASCNMERVYSCLDDLIKDGSIETVESKMRENGDGLYMIQYRRVNRDYPRKSRCMKLSKPWKRA